MRHWWALGVMMLACLLGGPARARPPALVWKAELGSRLYSAPLVCELLPSPGQEVVVCAAEARQVVALSAQGKVLWRYGEGFSARLTPSPAAGDLDGDGQPEIVVAGGGSPALLLCLDRAGARRWERRLEGEMDWSAPVIADLEGDGAPEIVVGTTSGQVCCYDGRGERRWQTKLEAGISSLLAVADVDGEGKAEVLVPCGRWLYCLDQAGQVKWRFEAPVACNGASVGDLEGDGRPDIVLACDEQTVYRLDAAGRMVWAYHGG